MNKALKQKLDYHYKAFDKSQLEPDPLQFPHKFKNEKDIELIAFISSIFAYGNIKQIINTLNKITFIMGEHPTKYLIEKNKAAIKGDFKGIIHRFFTNEDIVNLILLLKNVYSKSNSLRNIFLSNYNTKVYNIKFALESFSKYMLELYQNLFVEENVTQGIKFMFPLPSKGSVCKRMNLFLRWMVRKDELDFGLWDEIDKSKLIIPVDTHIARICRKLKLTKKKNINWNMAEEITENLKKYDPDDPVKYDFAICHIGMRKLRF